MENVTETAHIDPRWQDRPGWRLSKRTGTGMAQAKISVNLYPIQRRTQNGKEQDAKIRFDCERE